MVPVISERRIADDEARRLLAFANTAGRRCRSGSMGIIDCHDLEKTPG